MTLHHFDMYKEIVLASQQQSPNLSFNPCKYCMKLTSDGQLTPSLPINEHGVIFYHKIQRENRSKHVAGLFSWIVHKDCAFCNTSVKFSTYIAKEM